MLKADAATLQLSSCREPVLVTRELPPLPASPRTRQAPLHWQACQQSSATSTPEEVVVMPLELCEVCVLPLELALAEADPPPLEDELAKVLPPPELLAEAEPPEPAGAWLQASDSS